MIRLVLADLFQFLRRWLPYVLLLIMFLSLVNETDTAYYQLKCLYNDYPDLTYFDYAAALEHTDPNSLYVTIPYSGEITAPWLQLEGHNGEITIPRYTFNKLVLPHSVNHMFETMAMGYDFLLFIILAASFIGTGYRCGTLRQSLARGIRRTAYLGSKYITLVILALLFILAKIIFSLAVGMITTSTVTGGITWDFISMDTAGYLLSSMALITLILMVYASFTALFSIVLKSSIAGMIAGVLYLQIEVYTLRTFVINNALAANSLEWPVYTIGYNANYLLELISPNAIYGYGTYLNQSLTSATQSLLVLVGYCIVFIAMGFLIFRKQELSRE
jgi:ABC-type transport system involved in multi-copper enzyme maturation permease subunit